MPRKKQPQIATTSRTAVYGYGLNLPISTENNRALLALGNFLTGLVKEAWDATEGATIRYFSGPGAPNIPSAGTQQAPPKRPMSEETKQKIRQAHEKRARAEKRQAAKKERAMGAGSGAGQ
jgi:hypothetical protein